MTIILRKSHPTAYEHVKLLLKLLKSVKISWLSSFVVIAILILVLPSYDNQHNKAFCYSSKNNVSYDNLFKEMPYNYTGQHQEVAGFVEKATSYGGMVYILPEFKKIDEINNDDLILALTLSTITPRDSNSIISAFDLQQTAKSLFGPNVSAIKHKTIGPHEWHDSEQEYRPIAFGPIAHTTAHVLNVIEKEEEYIVYAAHMIRYSYFDYDNLEEAFYIHDEFDNLVVDFSSEYDHLTGHMPEEEDILKYLPHFPIRRYKLTKTGRDYYISSAEIVGLIAPDGKQPLTNLKIGDRVVDNSWKWDHGIDSSSEDVPLYSYKKPVVWIVVAKDHYGENSCITLLSEDIIGHTIFDDSVERGYSDDHWGSNHWGASGSGDATSGIRPWLNSTGIHKDEGFYNAFSSDFKKSILPTSIPCIELKYGSSPGERGAILPCSKYVSKDKVFIPSASELDKNISVSGCRDGNVFPFFDGTAKTSQAARMINSNNDKWYWTRTPTLGGATTLIGVNPKGALESTAEIIHTLGHTNFASVGTRAAVNIKSNTMVSKEPAANGIYLITDDTSSMIESKDLLNTVAYIPVRFSDHNLSSQPVRSISDLEVWAELVEDYYFEQSYGQVNLFSDFISDDWIYLDKTLEDYNKEAKKLIDDGFFLKPWKEKPYIKKIEYTVELLIVEDAMEIAEQLKPGKLLYENYADWSARSGWTNRDDSERYYDLIAVVRPWEKKTYRGIAFADIGIVALNDVYGYGVWAHEFGHALLGYKDYYGSTACYGDIKSWGLMGHGCDLNPPGPIMSFNKVSEGWLDYNTIIAGDEKPVKLYHEMQLGDPVLKFVPTKGNIDYYIIEGRFPPDGMIAEDHWHEKPWVLPEKLYTDKGILLYKVIENNSKDDIFMPNVYTIPNTSWGVEWRSVGIPLPSFPSKENHRRVSLKPGESYIDDLSEVIFTANEVDSLLYIDVEENVPYNRKIISYIGYNGRNNGLFADNIADSALLSFIPMENEFDIDLKVYSTDGLMIGMCYDTDEYLVEIPDARTSGNIGGGGPEWISVPDDIEIYYEIDTSSMEKWFDELFEMGLINASDLDDVNIEVMIQEILVDEKGKRSIKEKTETIEIVYDLPIKESALFQNINPIYLMAVLIVILAILIKVTSSIIERKNR